uniref:Ubiquitin-like domain-containing protein n=1 Tax=Acrobeloides nanus TaxID=290746 RepID=A0A914DZT6_9BILA
MGEIKRDLKRIYANNYANFNFSLSYEGRILGDLENLEETRIPYGGTVILSVQSEPSRNLWIQPQSNPPRSRRSIAQRFSRWINWADSKTTLPKPKQPEEPESIETLRQNLGQAQAQIASLKIQLENFKNEDVCIICLDKKVS